MNTAIMALRWGLGFVVDTQGIEKEPSVSEDSVQNRFEQAADLISEGNCGLVRLLMQTGVLAVRKKTGNGNVRSP